MDHSSLDPQPIAESGARLDSWKEIASYLKRSVRSVQRWEAEEGMPVHRHLHDKRGTVYAFKSELNVWWKERGVMLAERDVTDEAALMPESESAESIPGIGQGVSVGEISPPSPRRLPRAALVGAGFVLAVLVVGVVAWLSRNGSGAPAGSPRPLAFRARDWVLVAGFENRSGQPLLDGTLEYALSRELSTSRYVNVVPRERVGDALRLMRKPPDSPVDAAVGREVCLRDGEIRALLTGRVEKLGSKYLFSVEIVDAKQGATVAGFSEESAGTEGSLAAMRRISDRVRGALGETPAPDTTGKAGLAKVTTSSLRALQLYSQADILIAAGKSAAAEELLRQAVAEDPEFASAHIHLAHAIHNQGRPKEEFLPAAERAFRLSDRTTERERYFIRGSYYDFVGQNDKAVAAYEALVSIYPDHFWGTNNLTHLYEDLGRINEAARCVVKRTDLRPKDFEAMFWAAWYLTRYEPDSARARLYVRRTRELVSPAVVRSFPSEVAWLELLPAYERWLEMDAAGALAIATRFAKKLESLPSSPQDDTFVMLGTFFETVGRLGTAAEFFNRHSPSPDRLTDLALIRGNQKQLEQLSRTLAANSYIADPNLVFYLARSGLVDQAERILAELRSGTLVPGFLEAARGELAMARGRTAEAIHLLRKSQEQPRLVGRVAFWLGLETLASALARRGDLESAIRALEKGSQSKRIAVFHWGSNGAFWQRNQLLLARLYRRAGRAAAAQRIEAELLKLLAVADPDHPLLLELQRLQSS